MKRFFAGTDGYRPGSGFTGDNHLRVETLKNMADAEEIVIITESAKLARQGNISLCSLDEVPYLITDSGLPDDVLDDLVDHGIHIIKATI